ncbi:uncharacterized protein LOC131007806 [Salvia miltiorrhiza]|uniref:uncharacterized protein LOC131007806 n=1 Tax=Salvia miltiorrhiza TaxID=226208 RepID=UPI0025ABBFFA|nr:uncharacterized protein LOC131007806 [Salvia miltiorrhiza]
MLDGNGVHSPHAILIATADLNRVFKKTLRSSDIKDSLVVLKGRYETLTKLMKMPETTWDRAENRVYADDIVCEKIFMENVWAQAYYRAGEPEYYRMCALFGRKNIKIEHSHEVININSSINTFLLSDDDEVTSLVVKDKAPIPVNRKLFHDDAESSYIPPHQALGNVKLPFLDPKSRCI